MSDDILNRIDDTLERNRQRFDPFGPGWDEDRVIGHDTMRVRAAKAGTEEVSEPVEAAVELPEEGDPNPTVAQWRCRGCRLWMPRNVPLCGPCSVLPSCNAERSNALTGRAMVCFRPAGHDAVHEDSVTGSQWVGDESQVEAIRQTFTLDNSAGGFTPQPWVQVTTAYGEEMYRGPVHSWEVIATAGQDADQPEPSAPLPDASSDTAPDVPRKSNPFTDLYAALRARARRGGTR